MGRLFTIESVFGSIESSRLGGYYSIQLEVNMTAYIGVCLRATLRYTYECTWRYAWMYFESLLGSIQSSRVNLYPKVEL